MFWIHEIEVLAGQKKFTNIGDNALEIDFDVSFNDGKDPDVSTVTIYNLSDNTINDIKRDGYLYLNVGYKMMNNKANILTGEIEDIETTWSGLDKVSKITVGDGTKTWRKAELNKTYANGTKASVIMQDLANVLKYEIVEITPKNDLVYKLGKTIKGSASKSLTQLVKDTESKMFVNKNRIVIRDQKKGYTTGFVLNKDTGLVGIPTLNKDESGDKTVDVGKEKDKKKNKETKKTWKVTCLLNPKIETDSVIKIESKALNGTFRVISGRHSKDFNTELEVEEI
ncbi:conserved domain protein [Peptoniphilus sp. ING2-D1G]|nr:conserved domain protein [Peptoniphilus sp. ING2-D1G]